MKDNFKYIFKGKEVSKEQFEILTKDAFKWFSDNSINAVDFDSVSNFFSGDYKSNREINDHFKGVLGGLEHEEPIKSYNYVNSLVEEVVHNIKGIKESQSTEKAPIFTYCKQMKNAIEALSLRSLYGHNKYEKGDDWENFARVENGEFEYSNAAFRHALGIGEEDERNHLIAEAWNSVAKLELFLRKDLVDRK